MWYHEMLREQGFMGDDALEQYELLKKIDKGANGIVILAKHLLSETCYAIKGLSKLGMKKMFTGSREQTAEVQLLWQCAETKSPYILPIVETHMEDDTCYIVTKFLPGGNLYDMMVKQPNKQMPEPMARKLFKKLAVGLAGLKRRLIIHRDIKPMNILVSD